MNTEKTLKFIQGLSYIICTFRHIFKIFHFQFSIWKLPRPDGHPSTGGGLRINPYCSHTLWTLFIAKIINELCYNSAMKILGIDPGLAIVGYSILDYDGKNTCLLHSGSIQTKKEDSESARLFEIFNDITSIVEKYKPDVCAIEKLFFFRNYTTVMPVAHARGVILTVLEQHKIPIYEYTPIEVKQTLTGYGRADKKDVERMVKISLGVDNLPSLDDTVDSIAIAISYTRSINAFEDLKKMSN